MIRNKQYWQAQMAISLAGWVFIFAGFKFRFKAKALKRAWLLVTALWSLHPIEIVLFSYKIGREKGLGLFEIIVKTMAFGITWWKPLKAGIISR
ncbi:MAG: hypothetical protein BWY87_00126 [Deltaproteobacteria bacterium ADurb.Bin510]|nr:MAG: hypothetical protein BWY87_00126 [Deltaproteobacteria bacterium ADurb.Bin510]